MNVETKQKRSTSLGIALGTSLILAAFLIPDVVYATGGTAQNVGKIAENIAGNFSNLAKLITATAYLGGLGFAVGAILKFKQHKDNPTQVPIGTPVAMLAVAAAMIFMPTILGITGQSIFAATGTVGGPTGVVFGTAT